MNILRLSCFVLALAGEFSLAATAALPIEKTRESFRSGGRKIAVETFNPRAPGRFPAVLVLHSAAGTLVGKGELESFARELAERGFVTFSVRYFDRTGTLFASAKAIDKNLHTWEATIGDAMNFAAAHPRVRREAIGIFGVSLGAFLAVSTGARDRRVDAVAELSGGIFDYLGGRLPRVPPMLILHGTADERVSVNYARVLERETRRLGTPAVLKLYPGEGHVLSASARADGRQRALDFLTTRLRAASREQGKEDGCSGPSFLLGCAPFFRSQTPKIPIFHGQKTS